MKNLIVAMILFFCPMIVFAGFVVEPANPVSDMVAENVSIIEEIRAKYDSSTTKDCTPLFDTCQIMLTSHGVVKVYLVEPTQNNPGKFILNTGDPLSQRITIHDDNMNGVPDRIDDAPYDVSQVEGVSLLHDTLLDIRQYMHSTIRTKN